MASTRLVFSIHASVLFRRSLYSSILTVAWGRKREASLPGASYWAGLIAKWGANVAQWHARPFGSLSWLRTKAHLLQVKDFPTCPRQVARSEEFPSGLDRGFQSVLQPAQPCLCLILNTGIVLSPRVQDLAPILSHFRILS